MKNSNLYKLLIVLTVVLLAVAGVYFFVPAKKKAPVVAINSNQNTNSSVLPNDATGWKTYSNQILGIGFTYPKSWLNFSEHMGPDPGDEDSTWRDIEGKVLAIGPGVNFTAVVKKTNEPLSEFAKGVSIFLSDYGKKTTIDGRPALVYDDPIKYVPAVDKNVSWQSDKMILIDINKKFLYLDFSFSSPDKETVQKNILDEEGVLLSLKIF
jgi:hypothetical protein